MCNTSLSTAKEIRAFSGYRAQANLNFEIRVDFGARHWLNFHQSSTMVEVKIAEGPDHGCSFETSTDAAPRAMRELIGNMSTKDPNVTEEVYLSDSIRCRQCQKTAPIGIEVVTVKRDGVFKKVLSHGYYCRAHALIR